ncbi:MAG: LEA type 2 family protein [Pseudomonas sp.]
MFDQAKMIKILSLFVFCGLLSGLTGCSSGITGSFKDPQVHLIKVDLVKARLLEQEFILRFRIDNPNAADLRVRGLIYSLYLNDVKLTEGEHSDWFSVPAYGHRVFVVPVRTNLWRHARQVVKALESPDQPIRYRLVGEVKTGLLFGRNVHVARNGEIIPGDFIPE